MLRCAQHDKGTVQASVWPHMGNARRFYEAG
jgi:hypothetical protein